ACPNSQVVAAYDINTTANKIYTYNFPETALCQNNIQAISTKHLEKLNAQLWTMSPPCQPFTKKGSQQGIDDHRCDSFMALLEKLKQMKNRPRLIFLENVLGFETSSVHKELISTLTELQYGPDFVDGNRLTAEALADEEVLHDVVRLFSPREVANLMCFPMEFKRPADATDKQLYRCLGNSVNVRVVAALLSKLLHN
ncbi:C-5 cytosine-specific DNA methylase, partial [Teladorsagia circumcincta]